MAFSRRDTAILLIGDFIILVFSLWLALFLRNFATPSMGYFQANFVPFIPVFLLSLLIFFIAGLYEKQTKLVRSVMGVRIFGAQAANIVIAAVLFFLLPLTIAPKTILLLYLIISVCLISIARFYASSLLGVRAPRRALLVATGAACREMYDEVNGNNRYALVFDDTIDTAQASSDISGRIRAALAGGVETVVMDTRDPVIARELPALYDAMLSGAGFIEFSALYEDIFDRVPLDHIDYAWLLSALPREHAVYSAGKRLFDILFSGVLLIIALIFVIPAAVALLCAGGEPFIFHDRIGEGGRRFKIVKLRTMLMNDHGDPNLQKKNRVTRLGAFLRRTRIDELPQLWNIFIGDLSFIGPRPELPRIAEVYEREIPYYNVRHLISPGLSGWAQIHDYDAPRGPADVGRTRRKLSYDLYYLERRNFVLDLVIALKTLRALAAFSGT